MVAHINKLHAQRFCYSGDTLTFLKMFADLVMTWHK